MAILINNGVQNIVGTPGAISGVFGDRPAAPDLAEGTLYFSTDTAAIYQAVAGLWVNYAGGGGGGSSTGINGLNGTTNIGLGGTLNTNTIIDADNFSFDITNIKTSILSTLNGNAINIQDGIAGVRTLIDNDEKGLLVFGDRVLLGDYINGILNFNVETDTSTIFTNYSLQGTNGFILDFANGQYKLGDFQNVVGGSTILVDAPNAIINTFYNNTQIGIKLDFANNAYTFGSVLARGSNFVVDNFNGYIYTKNPINQITGLNLDMIGGVFEIGDLVGNNKINFNNNGEIRIGVTNLISTYHSNDNIEIGLRLDFANNQYFFGDFFGRTAYGISFKIDDNNGFATFISQGSFESGLKLNFANHIYKLGDLNENYQNTFLQIDDENQKVIINSDAGKYNFSNMPAYADNAAALAAGLVVGDLYRHDGLLESQDQLRIVH